VGWRHESVLKVTLWMLLCVRACLLSSFKVDLTIFNLRKLKFRVKSKWACVLCVVFFAVTSYCGLVNNFSVEVGREGDKHWWPSDRMQTGRMLAELWIRKNYLQLNIFSGTQMPSPNRGVRKSANLSSTYSVLLAVRSAASLCPRWENLLCRRGSRSPLRGLAAARDDGRM